MPKWFYLDAEQQQQGPVDEQVMLSLLNNGTIQPETYVFGENMDDWELAENSQKLQQLQASMPSPVVPPVVSPDRGKKNILTIEKNKTTIKNRNKTTSKPSFKPTGKPVLKSSSKIISENNNTKTTGQHRLPEDECCVCKKAYKPERLEILNKDYPVCKNCKGKFLAASKKGKAAIENLINPKKTGLMWGIIGGSVALILIIIIVIVMASNAAKKKDPAYWWELSKTAQKTFNKQKTRDLLQEAVDHAEETVSLAKDMDKPPKIGINACEFLVDVYSGSGLTADLLDEEKAKMHIENMIALSPKGSPIDSASEYYKLSLYYQNRFNNSEDNSDRKKAIKYAEETLEMGLKNPPSVGGEKAACYLLKFYCEEKEGSVNDEKNCVKIAEDYLIVFDPKNSEANERAIKFAEALSILYTDGSEKILADSEKAQKFTSLIKTYRENK